MRTVTTTLYRFNELPAAAKKRAAEEHRCSGSQYPWAEEALASIRALAEHFGGRVTTYGVDFLRASYSHMDFDMPAMERREIKARLRRLGTFNKTTLRGNGDCKLTGYCADEDAIDGFRAAFFAGESDLAALMQAAFKTWLESVQADAEQAFSLEGYAEHADANNHEFYDSGVRAHLN